MNARRDITQSGGADDGGLSLRKAATLLEQTRRQARRHLEPNPAWLFVVRAAIVLAVGGALWLSVRGQHPYQGPTVAALFVVAPLLVVNFVATLAVARRDRRGEREIPTAPRRDHRHGRRLGRRVRRHGSGAQVSPAIVYGWYPVAVPLIVAGLAWAGIMAARANWRECGTALAVAVVGAAAMFAGPVGAWAVAGVGLCATQLGSAAAVALLHRA